MNKRCFAEAAAAFCLGFVLAGAAPVAAQQQAPTTIRAAYIPVVT